jgi:DNA-directed RNA polymerase subunit RPC12/RpoP
MKSAGDIIEALSHVVTEIKCQACGATVQLKGKQYSARCPSCEQFITVTQNFLASLKVRAHQEQGGRWEPDPPNCGICNDRGWLIIKEQRDGQLCDFGYRCLCATGQLRDDLSGWPVVPAEKVAKPAYEQDVPF